MTPDSSYVPHSHPTPPASLTPTPLLQHRQPQANSTSLLIPPRPPSPPLTPQPSPLTPQPSPLSPHPASPAPTRCHRRSHFASCPLRRIFAALFLLLHLAYLAHLVLGVCQPCCGRAAFVLGAPIMDGDNSRATDNFSNGSGHGCSTSADANADSGSETEARSYLEYNESLSSRT